jgi:hypothetical protein
LVQEEPTIVGNSTAAALVISEAKAPYEKMLRWLQSLQNPTAFVAVTTLTLKPDAEDTSLLYATDVRVQKWYRNGPAEETAPAPAEPTPSTEPTPAVEPTPSEPAQTPEPSQEAKPAEPAPSEPEAKDAKP